MFLAILTFLAVNAFYLGLIGFVLYRVAQHISGDYVATHALVEHLITPIFFCKPKEEEVPLDDPRWTPPDLEPEKETF